MNYCLIDNDGKEEGKGVGLLATSGLTDFRCPVTSAYFRSFIRFRFLSAPSLRQSLEKLAPFFLDHFHQFLTQISSIFAKFFCTILTNFWPFFRQFLFKFSPIFDKISTGPNRVTWSVTWPVPFPIEIENQSKIQWGNKFAYLDLKLIDLAMLIKLIQLSWMDYLLGFPIWQRRGGWLMDFD